MRFLQALALICGLVAPAAAGQYFISPVTSTATGTAYQAIAGQFYLAASSASISTTTATIPAKSTWTISLNGALGAGYFRGIGANQFSLYTSSGITMSAGGIYTAFVKATTGFFGNLIGNVTGNLTGNVTGNVTGNADTATSATTATNIAGGASGSIAYQSAAATTAMLAKSINGYALQLAAGLPSWVPAVSSATNIAGGAAGSLPYQSAANTTAMLAAGANTQALVGGASAPAWSTVAGSTLATNISGLAAQASLFDHTPSGCSAGNYPTTIAANGNFGGCTTAGTAATTGQIVKSSETIICAATGVTATIPLDDTIPQISEGTQIYSSTFTMTSSANRLRITALVQTGCITTSGYGVAAIFKDTGPDAIAGGLSQQCTATSAIYPTHVTTEIAGYSGAAVFSMRMGSVGATQYINRPGDGRLWGGVVCSSVKLEEVVP